MTLIRHHSLALGAPLALALALSFASAPVGATVRGITESGMSYVSGGATDGQLAELRSGSNNYSFWLATTALGSGAYLADVDVHITEAAGGKLVLQVKMDGPWLFVSLPVGNYLVEATYANGRGGRPETQKTSVRIGAGDHHQAMLRFDTGDLVGEPRADGKTENTKR